MKRFTLQLYKEEKKHIRDLKNIASVPNPDIKLILS